MENQIAKTRSGDGETEKRHSDADNQSLQIHRPRGWILPALVTVGIAVAGGGGFWWIVWASQAFERSGDAVTFITGGSLTLALLLVAVVQACVYWSQRKVMKRQGEAMKRSLLIGEQQRDFLHLQSGTMRHQLDEMIGQKRAMENSLNVMKDQAKTMDKSLVFGSRAYLGGKPRLDLMDNKCHLFFNVENFGRVPAKNIEVIIELEIATPYQFVPHLKPEPQPPKMFGKWLRYEPEPDNHITRIPFLFAHGRTKLFPTPDVLPVMIRLEENGYIVPFINLIKAGHSRVVIRGRIQYSDGFHKDKLTEFAFRYYLKNDIWIPQSIDTVTQYGTPEEPASDYQPSEN